MSLGQATETRRIPRLSDVLFEEPSRNFATIAPLPSNIRSIEAALHFSTANIPFLSLVGPSGWGKSHLLEAVAYRIGHDAGIPPRIFSAIEWIAANSRLEHPGPLLLDNVQDALEGSRTRLALQMALERRVRTGRRTMLCFTSSKVTRQIKAALPHVRDWEISQISNPDTAEKALVVERMASAENLTLSPVLVKLLAGKMKGNGRTLAGAMKRLRLSGAQWNDARQILCACGVLEPFFIDNPSWDLHERIIQTAQRGDYFSRERDLADLVLHTMLRVASLSESSVARACDVQPALAYAASERFEARLVKSDETRAIARRFIGKIVESLSSD